MRCGEAMTRPTPGRRKLVAPIKRVKNCKGTFDPETSWEHGVWVPCISKLVAQRAKDDLYGIGYISYVERRRLNRERVGGRGK